MPRVEKNPLCRSRAKDSSPVPSGSFVAAVLAISCILYVVFCTFHIFLRLPALVASQGIESTGDVEAMNLPWGVKLVPVSPNGVRTPVFVQYQLVATGTVAPGVLLSNYSAADFPSTTVVDTYTLNGGDILVNRTTQSTTFPNNITVSFMFEKFSKPTFKNYFGWKMNLPAKGVKVSLKFENLNQNRDLDSATAGVSFLMMLSCRMRPIDDDFTAKYILTQNTDVLPVKFFDPTPLPEAIDPNPWDNPTPMVNFVKIIDKQLNFTVSHLNGVGCKPTVGSEAYAKANFLIAWPNADGSPGNAIQTFSTATTQMINSNTAGDTFISLPAHIILNRTGCESATSFEYDPDLTVLFGSSFFDSPLAAPVAEGERTIAIIVGASIAGVVAIVLVSLILAYNFSPSFRHKFVPISAYRDSVRVANHQSAAAATAAGSSSPGASSESKHLVENGERDNQRPRTGTWLEARRATTESS